MCLWTYKRAPATSPAHAIFVETPDAGPLCQIARGGLNIMSVVHNVLTMCDLQKITFLFRIRKAFIEILKLKWIQGFVTICLRAQQTLSCLLFSKSNIKIFKFYHIKSKDGYQIFINWIYYSTQPTKRSLTFTRWTWLSKKPHMSDILIIRIEAPFIPKWNEIKIFKYFK